MPRESYDYLTDATRDGLTDNVKRFAAGWGKCIQYVYDILQGDRKDPYAFFRSMYEGLCAGGVSTDAWDRDMAYLREKYAGRRVRELQPTEAFKDKFHGHSQLIEQYMHAISDGTLDLDETKNLLDLIAIEKPLTDTLETALLVHRAKLEEAGTFTTEAQRARR